MRPEGYDLVNAVRALGIELGDAPAPKCLKIGIDSNMFWMRLVDLQRSLDAFDKAGGVGDELSAPEPLQDDKLKKALDAILRLYEVNGGDMVQASDIIRGALELEASDGLEGNKDKKGKKAKRQYESLPVFAPSNLQKHKRYKARIKLIPDMPGSVSMDGIRRLGFDVTYVEAISGNTMQQEVPALNRSKRSLPFKKPF